MTAAISWPSSQPAATSVAVGGAVLAFAGRSLDPAELSELSLDVERRQHGSPSGIDGGTVIHGSVLWAEREAQGELRLDPVSVGDQAFFDSLHVYHSGEPAEATGAVVAAVRERRGLDVATFDGGLEHAKRWTADLRRLLEAPRLDSDAVITTIRSFQAWLESLGVVPEPVQLAVREVEAVGGAAKISGAGSLGGPGAGSLLVYHPRPEALADISALDTFERLDLRLGVEGVRIEA